MKTKLYYKLEGTLAKYGVHDPNCTLEVIDLLTSVFSRVDKRLLKLSDYENEKQK